VLKASEANRQSPIANHPIIKSGCKRPYVAVRAATMGFDLLPLDTRSPPGYDRSAMSEYSGFIKAFLLSALLVAILWGHEAYSVKTVPDTASFMEPAVRKGSARLLSSDAAPPRRGTIVAFETGALPGRLLFSRVVALGGDRVGLRDGRLVRNGHQVHEDYALRSVAGEDVEEVVVPQGWMYVLNDARDDAGSAFQDSRRLGPLPLGAVVGKIADASVEKQAEDR
jgi:signal peptidase I